MPNSPCRTPEAPDRDRQTIRWYIRLGAILAGILTGAIPGTIMLLVASGILGIDWKGLGTPFLICTGVGGICGLFFPRATLDYAFVFLAVFRL